MGARWLEAKKLKMRKQRKSWAKSYSTKNVGPSPQLITFNDKKEPVDLGLRARSNAAGNTFTAFGPWLEKIFPSKNAEDHRPDVIYARRAGLHSDILVLARLMKTDRLSGEELFNSVKVLETRFERCWMFFSGDAVFFIRQILQGDVCRVSVSITYGSLDRAKTVYKDGRITWKAEHWFDKTTGESLL